MQVRSLFLAAVAICTAPASANSSADAAPPPGVPIPPPPPRPFDDPVLREDFARWETRFNAAVNESSGALASARLAVSCIGTARPGSPAWSEARDATLRLVESRRLLRDTLLELARMNYRYSGKAPAPDLQRLRETAEWQGRFYADTEANVTGVFAELVRDR